jgi:uncharacterized SAM-binding protein YcdF (DUF218 family)
MIASAWAGFFLLAWPPIDWLVSRPLEIWYPVRPYPPASADAIVVLSAGIDTPHYERPYYLPDQETHSRCLFAAWLHRNWKQVPVLACGGIHVRRSGGAEDGFAKAMRQELVEAGVPDSSIWMEDRSRTTYENALYGAEILRTHGVSRIALVVEAQSMLRAAACFRKQGIDVVPAPSDFRQWGPLSQEALLSWRSIRRNEIELHETLGLAWYKLHGWI